MNSNHTDKWKQREIIKDDDDYNGELLLARHRMYGSETGVTTKLGQSEQVGDDIRVPHNERLHLSTDKKWIEQEGHQSDLIRLQWTAERAKPAIVWMDENGKDKTAIISHDKANNPERQDHKHISFETTMSPTGQYPTSCLPGLKFRSTPI